jgi:hypothetical protein
MPVLKSCPKKLSIAYENEALIMLQYYEKSTKMTLKIIFCNSRQKNSIK